MRQNQIPLNHIALLLSNDGGMGGWGVGGGGLLGVNCGGHMEMQHDIHNTDFCHIMGCYIFVDAEH